MTALEKFQELPHINSSYEILYDWGYTPSLYHFDGMWHISWIHCEDCDTLEDFNGDTPEEAINKAYEWFHNKFKNEKITMTKEEAYNYLREESSDTENGPMVHISCVKKAINAVSDDEELIEKALDGAYECEGNCLDWMQLDDAEWFVDIALGIKDKYTYF